MENDTGTEAVKSEEVVEETSQETEKETTDYKALYEEETKAKRELAARLKRAETKLERDRINSAVEDKVEKVLSKKEEHTGELNETQLDYLDLKGITHEDDLAVIQRYIQRTGDTLRKALQDDYVQHKLAKNKQEREVKDATPSSTKRSGNSQSNSVDYWLNKVETGSATLRDIPDFATRAAVVARREQKGSSNQPAWHK